MRHSGQTIQRSWWVISALVLALHAFALAWAQSLWQPKSRIQLMAEPVYARLITPQEPAALPKPRKPAAVQPAAQPQAAVHKQQSVASRPLPQVPTAAPVPSAAPTAAPPPEDAPQPVVLPPAPVLEEPLFAALEDDVQSSIPTPTPSPTPLPYDAGLVEGEEALSPSAVADLRQTAPPEVPSLVPSMGGDVVSHEVAGDGSVADAPATASVGQANGGAESTGTADVYQDWPNDTRINLKISGQFRGKVTGSGHVTWQREKERYQAQVQMGFGLGSLTMTSQGAVTDDGLNPEIFEEKIMGRLRSAKFEADTITVGSGKRIARAGLNGGLGTGTFQDSASQFVELAWRFATGRASLAEGQTVSYWLGRPEGLYQYVFDIHGPTPMTLPQLGTVQVWHLVPRPIPRLSKDAIYGEMWIAPSLQYLPVQIRMRNATGMQIDMMVDTVEQADTSRLKP